MFSRQELAGSESGQSQLKFARRLLELENSWKMRKGLKTAHDRAIC